MTTKDPARKSRFTPRAKTAQTTNERRYPLSLLLVGVGAFLTLAVVSWLGLLINDKDVLAKIPSQLATASVRTEPTPTSKSDNG